jgi:hypothetical protein
MQDILRILLSFPLVVFIGLLALAALYWLLVALRLIPLELFEHDSLRGDHLASTMVSLGFAGVPASFALTLLLLIGATITLALEFLVLRWLPLGMLRIPLGVVVIWAALVLASPPAAGICHRLQRWFHRHTSRRCLLGESVVVQTSPDENDCATAFLADDPDYIVRLHGKPGAMPQAGERRVLVKYLAEEGSFRSVAEEDYLDARTRLNRLRLKSRGAGGGASTTKEAALP